MSFLALIAGIFALAWAILATCIPFMIHAILGHARTTAEDAKAMRKSIHNIETNIYNQINRGQR